jgi:hypothetical protein
MEMIGNSRCRNSLSGSLLWYRVRDIQDRLSVDLWYHERRTALVLALVDKRGSKISFGQESALKFPRNALAVAA